MRLLPAMLLASLSAAAGCSLFGSKDGAASYDVRSPARGVAAVEAVFFDVALVERPLGDDYVERGVWDSGNEQGVELELKPLLEANGLRVCQFGQLPDGLLALLSSPRSCPAGPRRYHNEADKSTSVQVGPERGRAAFALTAGASETGEAKSLSLEQARFGFDVRPTAEDDDRLRLRFTPRVRHGKPRRETNVARDPDGQLRWAMEAAEPTEQAAGLAFDLSVSSGEYVVLGAWSSSRGTLGQGCFTSENGKGRYLLVLRATRVAGEEPAGASAPVAAQASRPTARGAAR